MELQRNTSLGSGKYVIISCLGQGGFGITYQARQCKDYKIVCVKEFFVKGICLRHDSDSDVQVFGEHDKFIQHKRLFIKEAETLMGLSHPNIIKVLDVFEENNTAYYVMELVEGMPLADMIPSSGMSGEEAISIISQVCSAVGYLHHHNITHLDIKPANILMSSGRAILIDFGGAKRYSEWGDETSTSATAASEGFAPVELYREKALSHFSPETDVYEIGATLYNMVSGKIPPSAWNLLEEPLPLDQMNIPASVARAIASAMRPHRQERCHDVDSFMLMLIDKTVDNDETILDPEDETVVDDSTVMNVNNKSTSDHAGHQAGIDLTVEYNPNSKEPKKSNLIYIVVAICVILVIGLMVGLNSNSDNQNEEEPLDSIAMIKEELADFVWYENSLSPSNKQSLVSRDSLTFEDNQLTFYWKISEEGSILFSELQSSHVPLKQYVVTGLRGDKKLYDKIQQLVQIGGSLRFVWSYGDESVEASLDSDELSEVVLFSGSPEDQKMQKYSSMAQNISNQCPQEVDEGMTMTSCEFEDYTIVYRYECTSETFAAIDSNLEEYTSNMSQQFMSDEAMKMFMSVAAQDNVNIVYEYKKKNSNSIIKLTYNTQLKKFI